MHEYEVRVTKQTLEQMKEITHYISYDLMTCYDIKNTNVRKELEGKTGYYKR